MNTTDKFTQSAPPVVLAQHLDSPDANSLYVLVGSLLATVISLPVVWYFASAAYAAPGLVS